MIMTSRDIVAGLARIDAGGMPDDVREAVEAAIVRLSPSTDAEVEAARGWLRRRPPPKSARS